MNLIENLPKPLIRCPECHGVGMHQTLSYDASVNVTNVDTEEECMVCEGEGEVTFSRYDEYMEWVREDY